MRCVAAALLLAVATVAAAADLPHHGLAVVLDPAAGALRATDRLRLDGGPARTLVLDDRFVVDRVVVDGVATRAPAAPGAIAVPAGARAVEVAWHGTLPPPPTDAVPDGPVLGRDGGWLSGAAWFPVSDERFTYDVSVDVPDDQRAVTAGRLVDDRAAGGRRRTTFASDGPAEELSLFTGPWARRDAVRDGVALRTWLHPSVADVADGYLASAGGYVALYAGWIGPYPYDAFNVASAPFPAGLGYPALTYLGTQVLRLPFIKDTSLGHEVLHAWWGNGVFVDPREGNWCEGLTTFMADYTFVERQGPEPARAMRLQWLRELALLPPAHDQPLAAFREKRHTASQVVGYHKAAMLFVMLRDAIGADAFTDGVRRFAAAHRFRAATWSDLRAAFEAATGRDLRPAFDPWLQRPGVPSLALRAPAVAARAGGGWTVTATLAQSGGAPWPLAVPVVVETATGPVWRTVRLDAAEQPIALDVDAPPSAIEADPDARVLRRLARDEVPPIVRHVAFDPAAVTIVAADGADAAAAARDVAARLLEDAPRVADADHAPADGPLLVVGTDPAVAPLLARLGLGATPATLAGRGTARVWAARRAHDGAAAVVVSAADAAALHALAGPLPHLGASSWLVFEGGRATDRGVWEPAARPLRAALAVPGQS